LIKILLSGNKLTINKGMNTILMGILNTSPESPVIHSIVSIKEAIKRAHILREHGASIIDVGGNSSSSKATDVSILEEKERVIPVIEALIDENFVVSLDSWTPEVVLDAAKIGIHLINDINGLENPEMRKIAKDFDLSVSIMHMRGKPKKHYEVNQNYENISIEILNWLNDRANELRKFGIKKERIIIDPGFGFGKSSKDNFLILKNLHKYNDLDYPVLVSASRKSFISEAIGLGQVQEGSGLFEATLGVQVIAALQNVEILRVHDVKSTKSILKLLEHYKKF
jgi:dihydropteroate synthase